MAFTTESLEAPRMGQALSEPSQFDLPSKEFVGYDPKGTHSITGSPLVKNNEIPKQAETPAGEQPTQDEVAPVEETVTLSPKVSALARKEQAQRQREQVLARREKELEAKLADADKFRKLQEKIAAKDYSAADELGLKYDEYVEHELKKNTEVTPEEQRFRKLEEELAATKKVQEEREITEYKNNQALWKQEIIRLVSDNEEFSTIKALGAEDAVLQHVNDSFEEDGVELTAEQAAKDIEKHLYERAEKFSSVPKLKNKAPEAKVLGPPKNSPKTITQNMTTTPKTATTSKPFHLMSESEQIQEAIRRVQAAKLQR